MRAEFDIQITPEDLYRYNLRQTYVGLSGITSFVIAGLLWVMAGVSAYSKEYPYMVAYLLASIVILLYIPLTLRKKSAESLKKNEVLNKPLHYVVSEESVAVTQGEAHGELPWDQVFHVVETKYQILVFTTRIHAYIFPKDQLGEHYDTIRAIVSAQLPPYRAKLKKR